MTNTESDKFVIIPGLLLHQICGRFSKYTNKENYRQPSNRPQQFSFVGVTMKIMTHHCTWVVKWYSCVTT